MAQNKTYKIDHRHLFFAGFLFYFATPVIAGKFNFFEGLPGVSLYQGFFNRIPDAKFYQYYLITLSWIPAFWAGHFVFRFLRPGTVRLHKFYPTSTSTALPLISWILILVLMVFTYLSRQSLFGGYGSYDISARGKMSSLLVLCNFFTAYALVTKGQRYSLLLACLFTTAFLLLSMGGRLYVFQSFVILLIFKTSFADKRWNFLLIISALVFGLLIGGLSGVWRLGANASTMRIAYSLFAEPIFTWFSTSTYLLNNDPFLINIPTNYLTSFLNIIPNTFVSLQPYIVPVSSMAGGYESPLGADSLWTNTIINFGIIGSMIYFFLVGLILNGLKYMSQFSRGWAVYYLMVCSILPFQFFRDGFSILHKQLVFNFLILPLTILTVMKLFLYVQARTQIKPAAVNA